MFFRIEKWTIKGDFKSLKNWKYKSVKLDEWRSNLQNNLYWGWFIPHIKEWLAESWNFITENKIHEDLKEILLQDKRLNEITWTYKKYVKSTANLNKKEFKKYLDDIEKYVFDCFGFIIPSYELEN